MPAKARARPSAKRSESPPVATSVDAIRRILRALRVAERQTHAVAGLGAAQLFVLRALEDGEPASVSDLARRTMTDRSSVAAVVDRLHDAGLVVRRTATADRRRAAIGMTAAGRAVLHRAPAPPTALLVSGLRALPERELRSLAQGLTALASAMGLSEQPAGMLFDDRP